MATGICKLCNQARTLIQAHVIPHSFFRVSMDGKTASAIIGTKPGYRPVRSPKGVYDPEIVCRECEDSFSTWDDYAFKFLIEKSRGTCVEKDQNFSTFTDVDYEKLKLFFLSLLWRAGVSQKEFYRAVRLGSHEKRLREMIRAQDGGSPDEYSVVLGRYTGPLAEMSLSPVRARYSDLRWYNFRLADAFAVIKCDSRQTPEPFSALMLKPGAPLHVMSRSFRDTREFTVLQKAARRNPRPKWFPPTEV